MEQVNLTNLQYSNRRNGSFALYVYRPDGYHTGPQYFRKSPRYPDEEITAERAKTIAEKAIAQHLEVRVCDGGDELVFHAVNGSIVYPKEGNFWAEVRD